MMLAGVPVSQPVAGIAMGLVQEGDRMAILSDILGSEDHTGDMDFKVAGSGLGITALQMDIKIKGVSRGLLEEALAEEGFASALRAAEHEQPVNEGPVAAALGAAEAVQPGGEHGRERVGEHVDQDELAAQVVEREQRGHRGAEEAEHAEPVVASDEEDVVLAGDRGAVVQLEGAHLAPSPTFIADGKSKAKASYTLVFRVF